jgi:hypothetical protein
MKEINKYLNTLKQFGEEKLKEYFEIKVLNLNDFDLVNSFLIYQSIANNQNLLIYLPDKQTKSQFYIPVILTLSLYEFINNYIDNESVFEIGDILQRNGKRYRITFIQNKSLMLECNDKQNTKIETTVKNVQKNYIITTAPLTERIVKTKFNSYKDFFTKTLSLDNKYGLPSKFKYKSIIVTDKKIVDELKKYKIDNTSTNKAFPFRYITKSGTYSDNIPIDPMIYIVNDYQSAKKHIIDKGIKIKNIIFIGANKYQGRELELSSDIANNIFENVVFVGSLDIQANSIPNLVKWKWTLPELYYFNYIEAKKINIEIADDETFENELEKFNNLIKSIEQDYNIYLNKIYSYLKNIFPIVIPNSNSRLIKQLDNLLDYFIKEAEEFIENEFYEIGEYDYEEIWGSIFKKFKSLIDYRKTNFSKYNLLKSINKINYLVVPKEFIEIWKEETDFKKIISFNEFKELKKNYNPKDFGKPNIVFLGFYGYNHLKEIIYNEFDITLLLYPIEKQSYDHYNNKIKNDTIKDITESDRKKLSDISFEQTKTEETVSELLQRLFLKNSDREYKEYDYSEIIDNILNYELVFDDGETVVLEENKTILLKTKNGERPEKIKNIQEGDKIRIYGNASKEELYNIALEADKQGIFQKIEENSKLWKKALNKYYKLNFSQISDLLENLRKNGLSITKEQTLKNWIDINSNVKFPQKKKDLNVLRKTINSTDFNENFSEILSSRTYYNGIMIALGRDLSDEITEFIKYQKKGEILKRFSDEQVKEMINQNAPLKVVKSIKLYNDEG